MSKFACKCGQVLNLSSGWSDVELLLTPERIIEEVAEGVESGGLRSAADVYAIVDTNSSQAYRCSNCNRLHIQAPDGTFASYVKE